MRITPFVIALFTLIGCLGLAAEARAEWIWDADAGWVNMGEPPPESDQGLYGYAAGLFTRGDYSAAEEYFAKVDRQFPDSAFAGKARFGRARCEARLGRPANATRLCNELLTQKPAGVNLEEVVSFQLEQVKVLSQQDPSRAGGLMAPIIEGVPTPLLAYEAEMRQARVLLAMENFDDARAVALDAAEKAPSNPARDDALLLAALCDLVACRVGEPSLERMDRAHALLQPVALSGRADDTTRAAQEYLALTENALDDMDVRHLPVYFAVTLLYQERTSEAAAFFRKASSRLKYTPAGETAAYYYAESLYRGHDCWGAFKKFQDFLTVYPHTERLNQVVEEEFQLGQTLNEQGEHSRALTVMEAVTENSPNGPLADDALMVAGRIKLDDQSYDDARYTFETLTKSYPRSEWATAALYFSGVATLKSCVWARDKEVVLAKARGEFEVYLRNEPHGTFSAEAQQYLKTTKEQQAIELMNIAGFYERRHEPKAAGVYYAMVVKSYPATPSVTEAQTRLKALPLESGAQP